MPSESSTINPSFTSSRLYPPLSCGRETEGEGGRGKGRKEWGKEGEEVEGGRKGKMEGVSE